MLSGGECQKRRVAPHRNNWIGNYFFPLFLDVFAIFHTSLHFLLSLFGNHQLGEEDGDDSSLRLAPSAGLLFRAPKCKSFSTLKN